MDYRHVLQQGTVLDRKYRIERVIGSGGFGITYEAFDIGLATPVAIKEYYPAQFGMRDATHSVRARTEGDRPLFERLLASFIREARTLARFDHAAIVRVLNVFEAHGTAYTVMKYEVGPSLKQWLAELGRQPSQFEIDRIAAPVLNALEMLHDTAYLHRDIAPDNIIVRADGTPVILDFGASRRVVTEMTGTVTGIVKQGYSPQEQYATDGRQQGPWTDIYAFGATLYRAVAGNPPNEATERMLDDLMRPAVAFANGDYRMDFLEGLDWSLSLRPRERPQNIREWRQKLFRGTYLEQAGAPSTYPVTAVSGSGPTAGGAGAGGPAANPAAVASGTPSKPLAPASGPAGIDALADAAPQSGPIPGLPPQRWSMQRMALAGGGLVVVAALFLFAVLPRGTAVIPNSNVAVERSPASGPTPTVAEAEEALRRARAAAEKAAREQAVAAKAAAEKAAAVRAAADARAREETAGRAEAERAAAAKAAAEKATADKAATEQRAREAEARAAATLHSDLRRELARLGCLSQTGSGTWGDVDRTALLRFARLASLRFDGSPTQDSLAALKGTREAICSLECPSGQSRVGGRCVSASDGNAQASQTKAPTASCSEINQRAQIGLLTEADRASLRSGTCR
ncbi:MAG: serine/threonine-protein kinase [Hyphomicrobiaceae bacterium]